MTWKASESSFSRLYDIEGLGRELVRIEIDPTEAEKKLLRDRLNIRDVKFLHADAQLQRQGKTALIDVHVAYKAIVTQTCVATLKPVDQEIEEEFSVTFSDSDDVEATPEGVEIVHTLEDSEPPDMIVGGKIDVAEILAEFIALALDPYPRSADAPGATGASDASNKGDEENKASLTSEATSEEDRIYPFANLKELMEKK